MFELNIVFARLINWPETLKQVGYITHEQADGDAFQGVERSLQDAKDVGKVFGDAYIVSTNGLAVPKAQYVCEVLLPAAYEQLGAGSGWRGAWGSGALARAYQGLIGVRGLGSFMAGQIIADLKNTDGHPLQEAVDWKSWCTPGPGSLRGLSWIGMGSNEHGNKYKKEFEHYLTQVRYELEYQHCDLVKTICNQDLQNCLCEFDKYCRIMSGAGRSKRRYNGV
jgi:hypothetical protein